MRNEYLRALTARFADARALMVIPALDEYAQWLMAGLAPTWYYLLRALVVGHAHPAGQEGAGGTGGDAGCAADRVR